jgi:Lrp/AsnC family leucine-responsive transcriptional regulator
MLDDTATSILRILQENGRTSTAEIGRRLDLAQSTVYERIREMERRGVIEGYTVRLFPRSVGLDLVAFVLVRTAGRRQAIATGHRLAAIPQVQEVHHVAGEDCLLVKVRARDTEALWRLFNESFEKIETIGTTRTTIVLETVKESSELDLGEDR